MNDDLRGEFGPLLRNAREKRGMSLQQVAAATKISARVLDALERNDASKLPGGIFSRSFVRAYAREVGLDPEETVTQFVAAFPPDVDPVAPVAPLRTVDAEDFESSRRTAVTLFQIAGLSIVVVIAWLVYVNLRPAPVVPAPPDREVMTTPAPVPPAAPAPAVATPPVSPTSEGAVPTGSEPGAVLPPPSTSALATPTASGPVQPLATPASAATTPAPAPATVVGPGGATAPAPDAPLAVSIRATDACWLSLSVDGTKVVARVLQPGERVTYQARTAVVLSAGNAGALSWTINGKPGKPLGGPGQVVTKTLTVESLKDFLQ